MRVFRNIQDLPQFKNAVLTIGTYDGVHKGHQMLIKRINDIAKSIEGESVIITFHPHPRSVVNNNRVKLISPLAEKLELLEKYNVDNVVVVPFTRAFSEQSPVEYIENFLYANFKPHTIVIGYDHKFGRNRAGDLSLLLSMSETLGFNVEKISKQVLEDISISSTKIREAVDSGEVKTACELMGHYFSIEGIVVKGHQLGSQIGFPTANIQVQEEDKLIAQNGVYAVKAYFNNKIVNGMLNIGVRPTIDDGEHKTIEVNLFEFDGDIYGEKIKLDLIQRIRAEQKFEGLSQLVDQLKKDRAIVEEVLNP